jgi:hypothetical protein
MRQKVPVRSIKKTVYPGTGESSFSVGGAKWFSDHCTDPILQVLSSKWLYPVVLLVFCFLTRVPAAQPPAGSLQLPWDHSSSVQVSHHSCGFKPVFSCSPFLASFLQHI